MVSVTQNTAPKSGAWFGRILDRIVDVLDDVTMAQGRVREIERLQSLSDAELAKRGIARDQIVHHVFRDTIGL